MELALLNCDITSVQNMIFDPHRSVLWLTVFRHEDRSYYLEQLFVPGEEHVLTRMMQVPEISLFPPGIAAMIGAYGGPVHGIGLYIHKVKCERHYSLYRNTANDTLVFVNEQTSFDKPLDVVVCYPDVFMGDGVHLFSQIDVKRSRWVDRPWIYVATLQDIYGNSLELYWNPMDVSYHVVAPMTRQLSSFLSDFNNRTSLERLMFTLDHPYNDSPLFMGLERHSNGFYYTHFSCSPSSKIHPNKFGDCILTPSVSTEHGGAYVIGTQRPFLWFIQIHNTAEYTNRLRMSRPQRIPGAPVAWRSASGVGLMLSRFRFTRCGSALLYLQRSRPSAPFVLHYMNLPHPRTFIFRRFIPSKSVSSSHGSQPLPPV